MSNLLKDENRSFRLYHISQVYMGPGSPPSANIVLNVGDGVIDWNRGIFETVSVDAQSHVPTLRVFDMASKIQVGNDNNLLAALSGYQPHIMNRAYFNDHVSPATITLDTNYAIRGTQAATIKIFLGTNTSSTGTVISAKINAAGDVLGENIDLEEVVTGQAGLKQPATIHTKANLQDNDVITMVVYRLTGEIDKEQVFVVKRSSAIRGMGESTVAIRDITLISPLLHPTETDLLMVPSGVSLNSTSFRANLHYTDGTTVAVDVDGAKTRIHGLDNFNSVLGGGDGTTEIVLMYYPSTNERVVNGAGGNTVTVNRTYRTRIDVNNLSYAFKAYVVPIWDATNSRYRLEFYLTNVARDVAVKLDPGQYTVLRDNGSAVNLVPDGLEQLIDLSFKPSDVFNGGYGEFRFRQRIRLILRTPTTTNHDPWTIDYKTDNTDVYGGSVHASVSNQSNKPISFATGATTQSQWLARLLAPIHPTFDVKTEQSYPAPTHFRYINGTTTSSVHAISTWATTKPSETGTDWTPSDTVVVVWLRQRGSTSFYETLGYSPMIIRTDL